MCPVVSRWAPFLERPRAITVRKNAIDSPKDVEWPADVRVELSRVVGGSTATAQHFSRRATRPQQAEDLCACFFDPVGINDGHCGSCSSVLSRRNALYDAPRVIIKHCSRTARQCATSQSSPEERRKLAQQSERQLNRALLAREPKLACSGAVWQWLNSTCSAALAERARHHQPVGHRSRGSASIDATSGGEPQEDLRDDVEWRSPSQD